jgi:poly-gamma-glutamate synthesis protein (capsule biosynthesis protein)
MKTKYIFLFFLISLTISIILSLRQNIGIKNNIINPISTYISVNSPTPTPEPEQSVTLGLMGDLGLGRHITSTARSKNDFSWSFQKISYILQQNDFNLANLESPIIKNCPKGETGTFTFCGDIKFLPYLSENKFIFNLANNHMFNYGEDGFSQTKNLLTTNQIGYFYSHQPESEYLEKNINGIIFGFLGFDYITNPKLESETIINLIKKYDSQVDWLVVSLHWGNEYLPNPEKWRIELAHQLVDVGADIIHGHHPHVLQQKEIYQDKPIYYSLGNFIFDQNWSVETSKSKIINLTVTKKKIINSEVIPLIIKHNSQPQVVI